MTQIYLNPYRPEKGELTALRKVARNYRATYKQYQSVAEMVRDTQTGRWIALESHMPTSTSVRDAGWYHFMHDDPAVKLGGLHLVTGSMNHGLPPEILDMMDYHVHVPQFDDVPFLAPASAAVIALHEIFMQTVGKLRAERAGGM